MNRSEGSVTISIIEHDRLREVEKNLSAKVEQLSEKNMFKIYCTSRYGKIYKQEFENYETKATGVFRDEFLMKYVNEALEVAKKYRTNFSLDQEAKANKYYDRWETLANKGFFERILWSIKYIFSGVSE